MSPTEDTRRLLARHLGEFDRAWERIGASVARADRPRAERAVLAAYLAAGLRPPEAILWADGPRAFVRSRCDPKIGEPGRSVRDPLIEEPLKLEQRRLAPLLPLLDPTGTSWHERAATRARRDAANAFLIEVNRLSLLGSSVLARIARLFRFGGAVRTGVNVLNHGAGQLDNLSFHSLSDFSEAHIEANAVAPAFAAIKEVMRNVGWIFPYERICWLIDRPTVVGRDPTGRLHRADGPAVVYPDGWAYYAWRDFTVPGWVIDRPELIHASTIDRESDPALRHIMIDIMTPEAYVRTGRVYCVGSDDTGRLWRKHWGWNGAWAAVEVVNGSPEPDGSYKRYFLTVPPNMRSPREAVAWTYGMREDEYASLRLRT